MTTDAYNKYLESEVLSADSVKLTTMLFRAAIEAVVAARHHLQRGEIAERSRRITKAFEIIHELNRSLDHSAGGEISKRLAALYDYAQARLLDANAKQTEAGLIEVERLLGTLAEGWAAVAKANVAIPASSRLNVPEYVPSGAAY